MSKVYYLDLFKLYKPTNKSSRIMVRETIRREEEMLRCLKRQHGMCFFCAKKIGLSDHLDHLIPIYWGGTNRKSNLVASCVSCNMTKSTEQLEISNPYTIKEYLKIIKKYNKVRGKPYEHKSKYSRLYKIYHAKLFKEV